MASFLGKLYQLSGLHRRSSLELQTSKPPCDHDAPDRILIGLKKDMDSSKKVEKRHPISSFKKKLEKRKRFPNHPKLSCSPRSCLYLLSMFKVSFKASTKRCSPSVSRTSEPQAWQLSPARATPAPQEMAERGWGFRKRWCFEILAEGTAPHQHTAKWLSIFCG